MNTSVIIEDIRKRSHRIHSDELQRRQELEGGYFETALTRRIINEAEEKSNNKFSLQSWKRTGIVIGVVLGAAFIIYRILIMISPNSSGTRFVTNPVKQREPPEDSAPEDPPHSSPKPVTRKVVMFDVDRKLDVLQDIYPILWRKYVRNYQADWLISPLKGNPKLTVDFYYDGAFETDSKKALDMITSDMLQFPSESGNYFETQEDFENFIFIIKTKKDLCTERGIVYKVLQMDKI